MLKWRPGGWYESRVAWWWATALAALCLSAAAKHQRGCSQRHAGTRGPGGCPPARFCLAEPFSSHRPGLGVPAPLSLSHVLALLTSGYHPFQPGLTMAPTARFWVIQKHIPQAHPRWFSAVWARRMRAGSAHKLQSHTVASTGSLLGCLFPPGARSSPGWQFWSLWSPSWLLSSLSCSKLFSGAGQLLNLPSGRFPRLRSMGLDLGGGWARTRPPPFLGSFLTGEVPKEP